MEQEKRNTYNGYDKLDDIFISVNKYQKNMNIPTFYDIYNFINRLFKKSIPTIECLIISFFYVHRLLEYNSHLKIDGQNWVSIWFIASMLAQKTRDDVCWKNKDYGIFVPIYKNKDIYTMETYFLIGIDWNSFISVDNYRKFMSAIYYYHENICI